MNRFFFRCPRCLFKFTADIEGHSRPDVEACPVCSREWVECLGATKGVLSYQTPCNDVCCFAEGPDCSCACGGRNHGSRLVVPVLGKVVDFKGKLPALDKARREWETWQGKLAAAKAKCGPGSEALRDLREAGFLASKSWHNRNKELDGLCRKLGIVLGGVVLVSAPLVAGVLSPAVEVGSQMEFKLC